MKMDDRRAFCLVVDVGDVIFCPAQDLGPGFTKVKDGIYVYAPRKATRHAVSC